MSKPHKFEGYHVGVAAEGFAAGLLAQAGYDVLVQYGANQPLYDLAAIKGDRALKVSVKGTTEVAWGITGKLKSGRSYAEATEVWLQKHGKDLVFLFVQFHDTTLGKMPRVYVARSSEVAAHLNKVKCREGDTTLWENHTWTKGKAKNSTDKIPELWKFSQDRIDSV